MISKLFSNYFLIINFRYKVQSLNDDDIIILLLSEEVNDKSAFSFLNDVKNDLFKSFNSEELLYSNGNQLDKGVEILKKNMAFYNSNPITTRTGQVIDTLNLAKDAMIENIETLIKRDQKMDIIAKKSDNLKDFSANISSYADNIRKNELETSRKNKCVIFSVIIVGIFLILWLFFF